MYAVIYTTDFNNDLTKKDVTVKLHKQYATKKAALKCAYNRNNLISQQVIGNHFYVYDLEKNECLSAEAA